MTKVKINPGLACVMLIASIFGSWECTLLVTLLMFVFCEVDEKIQNVATRVITFCIAYTIVSLGWSLIYDGVDVINVAITNVVSIINTFTENIEDYIDASKIIVPLTKVLGIADSVIDFLLLFAKLGFVVSIFTFKPQTNTPVSTKINEYINKVLNYINGNVNVQAAQPAQPQQPQAPVNPQQ